MEPCCPNGCHSDPKGLYQLLPTRTCVIIDSLAPKVLIQRKIILAKGKYKPLSFCSPIPTLIMKALSHQIVNLKYLTFCPAGRQQHLKQQAIILKDLLVSDPENYALVL